MGVLNGIGAKSVFVCAQLHSVPLLLAVDFGGDYFNRRIQKESSGVRYGALDEIQERARA